MRGLCCLLTGDPVPSGTLLDARVVGLIEQWEAGAEDHKVLLVPADAREEVDDAIPEAIMAFTRSLFEAFPDMLATVGPARGATQYLSSFAAPPR